MIIATDIPFIIYPSLNFLFGLGFLLIKRSIKTPSTDKANNNNKATNNILIDLNKFKQQ